MRNKIIAALLGAVLLIMAPADNIKAAVNPLLINNQENGIEENVSEESFDAVNTSASYEIIEIKDYESLEAVIKASVVDTWSQNKNIKLLSDIELPGDDFVCFSTFGGIFDGNGHTINGLNVSLNESYLGLFSKLQPSGVVRNLTVDGSLYPTEKRIVVGGIVGDNYGRIENCVFKGTVKGNDYTGGIAGYNETSGVISGCKSLGSVTGLHYTGGIAGVNNGVIYNCANQSIINTVNEDRSLSIDDINIDLFLNDFREIEGKAGEDKNLDTSFNTIDTGGIVGYNSGIIEYCVNQGNVGYERVGYNTGGIAGRTSGYVHGCDNSAVILGRKDVGGIVGQAEPNIQINLSDDTISALKESINELHSLVGKTLDDSGSTSTTISNRLSVVQKFVNNALDDTKYLSNETITFVNGLTSAGNETIGRIDYVIDEAGKNGGVLDKTKSAMDNIGNAAQSLDNVVKDADIYSYLSEDEKARYDAAKERIAANTKEYNGYTEKVSKNNYYFYLESESKTTDTSKTYYGMGYDTDKQLVAYKADGSRDEFPINVNVEENVIEYVKHADGSSFPDTASEQLDIDRDLTKDAALKAELTTKEYAEDSYKSKHAGQSYETQLNKDVKIMTDIVAAYEPQMSENAKKDLDATVQNIKNAANSAGGAVAATKDIVSNLSGRSDISIPYLSDGYRQRTSSFVANMQGMAENLGYLNNEMNESAQYLIKDMSSVNDSFNRIMLLFTDAINDTLEGDITDRFEDESFEVAQQCTDGAVDGCTNTGSVSGDLNTAGIAGTMGIEYDFDLESDVTSKTTTKLNATFKTKCVLRNNRNDGRIKSQKSYVGGMAGLQEMGTILSCANYGRIESASGDYVGGVVGNSASSVKDSYSRGIMSGGEYVGGIAGFGHQIYDCYAIPLVTGATAFRGAIAGEVDDDARLNGNYFVSDSLAGIDRISYSNMATSLSYGEFISYPNVPQEFEMMKITFLVDDEVIGERLVGYGKDLDEDSYPESVTEENYYIDWDHSAVKNVKNDMVIEGEPILYRTSIASLQLRENNQSVVLVDGRFKKSQSLEVSKYSKIDADIEGSCVEQWEVVVPDDGQALHQFRVQLPKGVEKASIYVADDSENPIYVRAKLSEMGMYQLFDVSGQRVSFVIVDETTPRIIYYIAGGIAGLIILIIIIVLAVMKRKKTGKKEKKPHKSKDVKRQEREVKRQSRKEKAAQLLKEAKDDSPRSESK